MAKQSVLKAGSRVEIIFESEISRKDAHYLKAVIYDYEKGKIIISQTTPPLDRQFLGRKILVTFLVNSNNRLVRFGFSSRLLELIDNYEIASEKTVSALILEQKEEPSPLDFRMYFRVKPPLNSDLSLFYKEDKFNLLDISLGGAKFTHDKSQLFKPSDTIKLKLIIAGATFDLEAKVREVWLPDNYASPSRKLQYVSVEFIHDNKQLEALLGRAILTIERELLSEGKL